MRFLSNVWYIAQKDLQQLVRDRAGLLLMFAVPLFLMGILGAAIGSFGNAGSINATLPVIDRGHSKGAQTLIATLRRVPNLELKFKGNQGSVEKSVRNGDDVGVLIIPRNFETSGTTGGRVAYYTVTDNSDAGAQFAQDAVKTVTQRMAFQAVAARAITRAQVLGGNKPNPQRVAMLAGQATAQLDKSPPVSVRLINATGRKYNAASNTVPGYALMFALFAVTAGAGTILKERESGTLKRLLVAPVSSAELLGGKLMGQFIQTLVQLSILLGAGSVLFKINLGSSFPGLILLLVGTAFAATGIGMLLVSFVRSRAQLSPITTLIVLSFSALGGSWWPISIEPKWMQTVSDVTVTAWAMRGFNGFMIFDKSFVQVLPDIGALFIYGLVCFAIARRTFRLRAQVA